MKSFFKYLPLFLFTVLMMGGCSKTDARYSNVIETILIEPSEQTIDVNTTQVYEAFGVYSSGTKIDVTDKVLWKSSNSSIAVINVNGEAKSLGIGDTTITATLDGVVGNATLHVKDKELVVLDVLPADILMHTQTTQKYRAIALYSDGSVQNISKDVEWSLENNSSILEAYEASTEQSKQLLSVYELALAVKVGKDKVIAKFKGIESKANVEVADSSLVSYTISPIKASVYIGTQDSFIATGVFADGHRQDLTNVTTWSSSDTDVVSVSNTTPNEGFAKAVGVGSSVITGSYFTFSDTSEITVIDPATVITSIDVFPTSALIYVENTQQYSAIATFADNSSQDITSDAIWSSSDSAIASIENSSSFAGLAHGVSTGSVDIRAQFSGFIGSAILEVKEPVLETISLSPLNQNILIDTKLQFTALGYYSDKSVQDITNDVVWLSETPSVALISNELESIGVAHALSEGITTIAASKNGISAQTTLSVHPAAVTIVELLIEPKESSVVAGLSVEYTTSVLLSNGAYQDVSKNTSYRSSDNTIAEITSNAIATGVSAGTTSIIASLNYEGSVYEANATLHVNEAVISSIQVTPADIKVVKGKTGRFSAIAFYSDSTSADITALCTWGSSQSSVVSIVTTGADAGYAQALEIGNSEIQASYTGINSNSAKVEVIDATLVSLNITPSLEQSVAVGLEVKYKVWGIYSDNSTKELTSIATWSSSEVEVATIESLSAQAGVVTTHSVGSTLIGASVDGLDATTVSLVVTSPQLESIQVTPANVTVPTATHGRYSAIAFYSDASSQDVTSQVIWVSDNSSVVSIVTHGVNGGSATALIEGSAKITASLDSITSNTALVKVKGKVIESVQITPNNKSFVIGEREQYHVTVIYTDLTTKDVTEFTQIQSSDTSVATFDSTNIMHAIGAGTAELSTVYEGVVSEREFLHVSAPILMSIQVTPADVEVPVETSGRFSAVAFYSDNSSEDITQRATWISSDSSVLSIIASGIDGGIAEARMQGNSEITATLDEMVSNSAKVNVVGKTIDNVQITPNNKSFVIGETEQYHVTVIYTDLTTKDVTESAQIQSSDTSVATFESSNIMSAVGVGSAELSAVYEGVVSEREFLHVSAPTLTSIQVTPATQEVAVGAKDRYVAIAYYSDESSRDVSDSATWISDNTVVATIVASGSNGGLFCARTSGVAHISASLDSISSNSATLNVTGISVVEVQITPSNATLTLGSTTQYHVYALYSDDSIKDVTAFTQIRSSDSTIATFDTTNRANAVGLGDVELTTMYEGVVSVTEYLHVKEATLSSIQITPSVASISIGDTKQYIALATYSDNSFRDITLEATWISSDRSVAVGYIEDSKAYAQGIAEGNTTISASLDSVTSNSALLEVIDTSIVPESISITPLDETISAGNTLLYSAYVHFSDGSSELLESVDSWTSSDTSVATITTDGVASAIVFGESSITAYYSGLSASTTLNVIGDCGNSKPVSIYIIPDNASLSVATQLQYELWGLWSNGCEMQLTRNNAQNWASGDESIVSIDKKDGLALGISNGTTTINADYQSLTTSTPVTVLGGEEVLSVSIQPAPSATLAKGQSLGYICSARTAINGVEQPEKWVTAEASFVSSNTKIATIGINNGSTQSVDAKNKAGHTTISCYYGSKSSASSLDVE